MKKQCVILTFVLAMLCTLMLAGCSDANNLGGAMYYEDTTSELQEGKLTMYINEVSEGEFTFAQAEEGWTICNASGKYVALNSEDGSVITSATSFVWSFNDAAFSATFGENTVYLGGGLIAATDKPNTTFTTKEEKDDGESGHAAYIKTSNGTLIDCKTFDDAWEYANTHTNEEITITLKNDVLTTGRLVVPARGTEAWLNIDLDNYTINRSLADPADDGSVIWMEEAAKVNIRNGIITGGNSNGCAGGIFVGNANATLLLEKVTIKGNKSVGGGGLCVSLANKVTLRNCVIENNEAEFGGGIYMTECSSTVKLENTTITGNTAASNGGGMYLSGSDSELQMENVTITQNSANHGGGIHWDNDGTQMAEIRLDGTIKIAENTGSDNNDNMMINPLPNDEERLHIENITNDS